MDKLFKIIKKCYNHKYEYSIKKNQIILKDNFNDSLEFINFQDDCYFFYIKDLSPLFNFFKVKMNNEYLEAIFKKYEEIFLNYGVFDSLITPAKNSEIPLKDIFKNFKSTKYKEINYKYIKESNLNIYLDFRLDKNLSPFFFITLPIHYDKNINFNIYDDFAKNDLDSIYKLLNSEMKKIALKEIKIFFNKISNYKLKKMSTIEIKQHIEICRMLEY